MIPAPELRPGQSHFMSDEDTSSSMKQQAELTVNMLATFPSQFHPVSLAFPIGLQGRGDMYLNVPRVGTIRCSFS
jgi:hypothetical protein